MTKRTLISLFTGAGGLDLGLEAAGFKTRVAVEMDGDAVATLKRNRRWPIIHSAIKDVSVREILRIASLRKGEADLLAGGPPCQPFSKSGQWAGTPRGLSDPRAATLDAYFEVLEGTLPATFLIENVPQFVSREGGFDWLRRRIAAVNKRQRVNYSLQIACLNAANYGVPQMRRRAFVVGHREGREFVFPASTHEDPAKLSRESVLLPYATAWDAIGELGPNDDPALIPRGRDADLLPSIPEGSNYLWHTNRGGGIPLFGWRTRYWSLWLKLAKNQPSWTLTASPAQNAGPFHWDNRRLSIREMARLQTFPDSFEIVGDKASATRQVGNAVPPAMADVLGRAIRVQLLGDRLRNGTSKLAPERLLPVPQPERRRPVPRHHLARIKVHPDHPGAGLGPGAQRRRNHESSTVQS